MTKADRSVLDVDLVEGPASAVADRIATFNGTTGKLIKDSGKVTANLVDGPASAVANHVALFDGVTGKIIKDGGMLPIVLPQGRLTLTSGQPVQIANATAATVIYYTPCVGDLLSLWDGVSSFISYEFAELALSLAAAYHPVDKNYDLYVVRDGGTLYLATGPAWAGDNYRGTGAASAEIETVNGIKVNKNAITVRIGNTSSGVTVALAARAGTKVGWVRTSAAGQTEFTIAPAAVNNGTNNKLFFGNSYNRRPVIALERDAGPSSWTLATVTVRAAHASNANRVSFVIDDDSDWVEAIYKQVCNITAANAIPGIGIGLDSTTVIASDIPLVIGPIGLGGAVSANYAGMPGIGLHYLQAMEQNLVAATASFNASNFSQMQVCLMM